MHFCYKTVRSIRNTTLKLCTDCVKQFMRNAQNCGKTNHGFLYHDNAPTDISMLVREGLARNETVIISQPSPDFTPTGFFLCPNPKTPMKRKHFATIEAINEKSRQKLLVIPKNAFQKCFEAWKKCYHSCITSRAVTLNLNTGYYFFFFFLKISNNDYLSHLVNQQ